MTKQQRRVKCEGRFSELREFLFDGPRELVLEDRVLVSKKDLEELWSLVTDDIFSYDVTDPYFHSTIDRPRQKPKLDPLSLVPLFPSTYIFEEGVVSAYAASMDVPEDGSAFLEQMANQRERFYQGVLQREPRDIEIPGEQNLSGYRIAANIGIGTISEGGTRGAGIRSDAPFLLEIKEVNQELGGEVNLAAVVGFWAQHSTMIVSQMQECKNAKLPKGVGLGVGCLSVAEHAAKAMGFERIIAYTAKGHPNFKQHPDSWGRLKSFFDMDWDRAVAVIGGYRPAPSRDYYIKNI